MGARWGMPDATALNGPFRSAYGLPPGEYRALHLVPWPLSRDVADPTPRTGRIAPP